MAGPLKKKAKLAHEKKVQKSPSGKETRFSVSKVLEIVEWPKEKEMALVDIDGKQTLGLIEKFFVIQKPGSNEWVPASFACPVVYDHIAKEKAVEAYSAYQAQNG